MRARDIMTSPVITVGTATPVHEAAHLLATHGFTALPVLDEDDRLIGIVTEADVMRDRIPGDPRSLVHPPRHPEPAEVTPGCRTVAEVMSSPVVGMGPGTDVAVLSDALVDARQRSMPIVDGGRLVGIVTRRDIVRVIGRDDREIARDVRHKLATYGGPDRFEVQVHDGVVVIGDSYDDPADLHVATVLARAVPGVVHATAHHLDREQA